MLKIKPSKTTELWGWYGMAAVLLAYILVSFKVLGPGSFTFQALNLTGGAGLVIVAVSKGVIQSALLNIFWCAVALIAIVKIVFLT